MTTYTKILEGELHSIDIDPSRVLSEIDPNTYGGFTEHMGRCIYGGLYDPDNPLSDRSTGFRKDVISALQELNIPNVRYPGGNFVATYHWLDGVGPRSSRPRRPELAWLGIEPNSFGTDEFMAWCKAVGTEPYMCLNFGTGTLDEAMGWVEYCNGTKDTYYANLRRANGHAEPYKVKYWALGNEVYGPWQVCQMTKEDYAKKAIQWAKALRLLDPEIKLILCGETGYSDWDHYVLHEAIEWVDYHSIHIYTVDEHSHLRNATAPHSAERAIEITGSLIDLARITRGKTDISPPKICFDEWNVWSPTRAVGSDGAEETYTLSDALAVASWLNVFIRQSRYIGMANIAQSVNVISPLMTTKEGLVKQTTWWPLLLFSKYMRGNTLGVHVRSGMYEGDTTPSWIKTTVQVPWLDVSAALNEGHVCLAVVNRHEEKSWTVAIQGLEERTTVETYTVTGAGAGVTNMGKEGEVIGIKEDKWEAKMGGYEFGKLSFTLLRWKA